MSNDLHQDEEDIKSTLGQENEEDENWFEKEESESDIEKRLARMEKGLSKFFSEQGRAKKGAENKDEKEVTQKESPAVPTVVERLYFNANPEAKLVWDDVKKAAKLTGKDPYELYEDEPFFKEKALSKANSEQSEQSAKEKVNSSSKRVLGTSSVALTSEEKRLLSRRGLTEKDINKYNK